MKKACKHIKHSARQHVLRLRRQAVDEATRDRNRLVMTLLVRNEEQLLETNLDHHLAQGVDFVIATDHASVDRTPEILERYRREGRLHWIREDSSDFDQASWVNAMTRLAIDEHGADLIFHCDADELWHGPQDRLKDELLSLPDVDALKVPCTNVLLRDRGGIERFPEDAVHAVVAPYSTRDLRADSRGRALHLFPYPPKVFFKTAPGLSIVDMGNHGFSAKVTSRVVVARQTRIFHFPIQGRQSFGQKVWQGGEAIQSMPVGTGWHWRRWYRAAQAGRLDLEYRKLVLSDVEAASLIRSGRIRPLTTKQPGSRCRFCEFESDPSWRERLSHIV